jgi:hypothetical protein
MKFSITQNGAVISSVYFNDNTIKEIVTFWSNIQYQSPQFALDLSPSAGSQLDQLYPNGLIPNISMSSSATFEVLTDSPIISNINIIEIQLNFIGAPDSTAGSSQWTDFFEQTESWVVTPANTAYVPPVATSAHQVVLEPKASDDLLEISYKILVSFQVDGSSNTYYAIIDPLAKVTNNSGG